MQVSTKPQSKADCNENIDNLAAIRLAQEPWRFRKAILKAELPMGAKLVAMAIVEFINRKSGCCFASEKTIAESCGLSERGARKAIAQLREGGWLRVVRRGVKQTNLIYLALPVTGTAERGDRHQEVGVTGTAVPPNLREEPLRDNQTDRPIVELPEGPSAEILSFDGRRKDLATTTDRPIRRATNEDAAYAYIVTAAMQLLGRDQAKMPDGRYLDREMWLHLPPEVRADLARKAISGRLMRSEVALVFRGVDEKVLSTAV